MKTVLRLTNDHELKIVFCDKVIVKREYNPGMGLLIKELVLVRNKDNVEYHDVIHVDEQGYMIYESNEYTGWSTCNVDESVDLKIFKEEEENYKIYSYEDCNYDDTDIDYLYDEEQ